MRACCVAIGVEFRYWRFASIGIAWGMVQGPDIDEDRCVLWYEVSVDRVICFTLATVGLYSEQSEIYQP